MNDDKLKTELYGEMDKALQNGVGPKLARFALACLGGVPIAGGIISGIGGAWSEKDQDHFNKIFSSWLKLQEDEIREIGITIMEIMIRLDQTDELIQKRIESPEYLKLLKKCFRDWSAAESEDKRVLVRNVLVNSASASICSDDVVRLFIEWINKYSEAHFAVIKEIYNKDGITRHDIWLNIHGNEAREDSAEADLFKLLVSDLSTGHVIRQHREVDYNGNYMKQKTTRSHKSSNPYMTSAFDDNKSYELTELGKQFVHYTMNEIVPRISSGTI